MTDIAETETLQEGMETGAVIRLLEVTQFVEEDVVAEGFWKTDEIEVQIDVAGTGTASPVGRIVLEHQKRVQRSLRHPLKRKKASPRRRHKKESHHH